MDIPKITLNKILYTTDLSESVRPSFSYAASLAHNYNAELSVIHVVEDSVDVPKRLAGYMTEEFWEELKKSDLEEARRLLVDRKRDDAAIRECVGRHCEEIQAATSEPYVTYSIIVKAGNPVEIIINEIESGGYDLLVIGRYGHGTLKDSMMGSTVRRVLRRVSIPALLVPVSAQG